VSGTCASTPGARLTTWLCAGRHRALWPHLLAVADRAGYIRIKQGERRLKLLAGLLLMPLDVVEVGLPDLLEDGRIREILAGYFIPNYIAAQEAKSSDAERQRKRRERLRDQALAELQEGVTKRDDDVSRNVTDAHDLSRNVTDRHVPAPEVTPSLAVPSRAVPPPPPNPPPRIRLVAPVSAAVPAEEEVEGKHPEGTGQTDLEPAAGRWSLESFSARWDGHGEAIGRPRGLRATPAERRKLEALLRAHLPSEIEPALEYFHAPPKGSGANWPDNGFPLGIFLKVVKRHLGPRAEPRRVCRVCREPGELVASPRGGAVCYPCLGAELRASEST
jgi:hypothetical protein